MVPTLDMPLRNVFARPKESPPPRAIGAVQSRSTLDLAPPAPRAAEGAPSRAEFDAFYRAHSDFVFRCLRRLCVREAALDDALQEVFIVVHRRFHELRPGPTQRAWLFAIAQRVASGQRRWVRRKGHGLPLNEELVASSQSPLEGAMQRQAADLLLEFLAELDEPRRAAFVLAELEQMTGAEAHAALGVNQNTLYYRLSSARKAFVEFLVARGVIEGPAREDKP